SRTSRIRRNSEPERVRGFGPAPLAWIGDDAMANPADLYRRGTGLPESDVYELVIQVNNIVETLRALTAKLDADSGTSDSDYAATLTDDTAVTAPAKILV